MVPFSVFTYYIMEHDFNISSHHPSYFHFLLFRKSTDTPLYVPDSLACDGQMLVFVEATKTENSSSVRRRKKGRKKEKKKKSRSAQQLQFHLVWFLSGRFSHCHSSICTSDPSLDRDLYLSLRTNQIANNNNRKHNNNSNNNNNKIP